MAERWKEPDTGKLLAQLTAAAPGKPRIVGLRFPRYRNLVLGSRISFPFPLTVLVGKNGTNKSSLLHAIFGSVANQTPSQYWFETAVDRIEPEVDRIKNSIVTTYVDGAGKRDDALKYRTYRKGFEAYWEAAKRTSTYGFPPNHGRALPVKMSVEYFDFRSELSAFDKFFYFPDSRRLKEGNRRLKAKLDSNPSLSKRNKEREYKAQDYIRNRAPALKKALASSGTMLTPVELDWISWILGREYIAATFLRHSLYGGNDSNTVFLEAKNLNTKYSSAFAGSGEFAVAVLVHKLWNAASNSLILLDEPETSLHPTAQSRLRDFLLWLALRRKFQIVAATHSSVFAVGLPANAVKLFRLNGDGKVQILDECSPEEAFHEIDENTASQFQITVEDKAAKILVEAVIQTLASPAKSLAVRIGYGGVPAMWRDIETRAREDEKKYFTLFDGDQRPSDGAPDPESLPANISGQALEKLVRAFARQGSLSFAKGEGSEDPRLTFLKYAYRQVQFLPGSSYPEALVWDDTQAREILTRHNVPVPPELFAADFKKRFGLLAELIPGQSWDAVYRQFVSFFVTTKSDSLTALTTLVESIRAKQVVPPLEPPAPATGAGRASLDTD